MLLHNIRIATLNCCGLTKINQEKKQKKFIRFLRNSGVDILVLQETHANNMTIQDSFNMQFQTHSSTWTKHCGILSLNKHYSVSTNCVGIDGRFILSNIVPSIHYDSYDNTTNNQHTILQILNIYAPAVRQERKLFYAQLMDTSIIRNLLCDTIGHFFIMGDFNHTYSSSSTILPTGTTREWIDCLQLHYHDCFEQDKLVTFRRGEHSSTIDHIFCRPDTSLNVKEKHQGFLNSDWTDHSMLEISFMFNIPEQGPGTWKANPFLAKNIHFKHAFQDHLQYLQSQLPSQAEYLDDREIWDWIKVQAKTFIRTFQLQQNNWRKKQLNKLQKKRNRILRTYKHFNILHTVLPTIEQQIGSLQDQISEIECLKAGKFWRENNEKSPGFLKRLIKTRESQRYIPNLTDPVTETMCSSKEEKMNIVEAFYDQLYDPDPVDDSAMTSILTHIPDSCKLTDTQKAILTGPITIEDVLLYSKRSPKKK